MKNKNLKTSFALLFLLSLSACSLKIKDQEWCGDMGSEGATCFHTLTDETRDIPKDEWDNERFGQLCTSSDNFADLKKIILKVCSRYKCNVAVKQQLLKFAERTNEFNYGSK